MALIKCPVCGTENASHNRFCRQCSAPISTAERAFAEAEENYRRSASRPARQKNVVGLLGFIFAICAALTSLVLYLTLYPFYDQETSFFCNILWVAGLVLSIIGLKRKPNKLAIAGLVITGIVLIAHIFIALSIF